LKTKQVGKGERQRDVTYVPWYNAVRYLDKYAPGWSYRIKSITPIGKSVVVVAEISITAAEGIITRQATGIEDDEVSGYGDPSSNAESMALRRAAAKFGLGLYLYDKGNGAGESNGGAINPRPKTLGDLITPKQLWMIRNMGREIGCDVEAECRGQFGISLEEISKRAASSFIDYLKRIGEEGMAGAQKAEAKQSRTTPADELRALNRKLGFTDAQLLKWLTEKKGLSEGLTLSAALNSLGEGEMSQVIDIFRKKLEEK
jgi:hypothetical protein